MAALWLASYPDGGVRKCSPGRPRACLATQRWFQELLDEHGEGVADSMLYMLQQGGKVRGQHGMTKVHGLIRVTAENCSSNDSGVTPWHRESQLQRLLYDLPLDDYDVAVVDYQGCEELQEISHKLSRFEGSGGLSKILWTMPLFVAHWADAAGQVALHGGISASEQLRRWGFHDADANCVPVITVPWPIAFLIIAVGPLAPRFTSPQVSSAQSFPNGPPCWVAAAWVRSVEPVRRERTPGGSTGYSRPRRERVVGDQRFGPPMGAQYLGWVSWRGLP